jgi:transcriptional regulator with XRE-family HTH domain
MLSVMCEEAASMPTYNELVGRRLRSIRKQRGMSLQDVQRVSDQEFKAAVLGAYERGERSLSVPRLRRLAMFYGVPVTQLLPPESDDTAPVPVATGGMTIDLNRVEQLSGDDAVVVERFLRGIQMMRQDFNGKVLTIRSNDLRTLSMLVDQSVEGIAESIDGLKLTNDAE